MWHNCCILSGLHCLLTQSSIYLHIEQTFASNLIFIHVLITSLIILVILSPYEHVFSWFIMQFTFESIIALRLSKHVMWVVSYPGQSYPDGSHLGLIMSRSGLPAVHHWWATQYASKLSTHKSHPRAMILFFFSKLSSLLFCYMQSRPNITSYNSHETLEQLSTLIDHIRSCPPWSEQVIHMSKQHAWGFFLYDASFVVLTPHLTR